MLIVALDLLQQDVSWEALKRTLREARIRIENLAEVLDRTQTLTIQPEPIPLDLKIVLFGEPWLFYRLREFDSEFGDLFKVQADFSTSAARDDENCTAMLRLLASMARRDGLKQLAPSGAAWMIDEAGTRKSNGCFQRGSFNARVSDRLTYFARPRLLRPIRLDGWWPF